MPVSACSLVLCFSLLHSGQSGRGADVAHAARAEPQEPEPEVDLSNLFAKVAQLDSSRSAIPGLPSEEQRRELEEDVDRSLAYLHARQRERERGKGAAAREEEKGGVERREITEEERREMGKERERAEALRGEWSPPLSSSGNPPCIVLEGRWS